MSQPSVINYFATRKRTAVEESNISRAKKVLILDSEENEANKREIIEIKLPDEEQVSSRSGVYSDNSKDKTVLQKFVTMKELNHNSLEKDFKFPQRSRVVAKLNFDANKSNQVNVPTRKTISAKPKHKKLNNQIDIQTVFLNMKNKSAVDTKVFPEKTNIQNVNEKTPPSSPIKSAMNNITKSDLSLNEIKTKLTRSARLAELKASLVKFNKSAVQLKAAEKITQAIQSQTPALNKFRSIELEVQLSPKKSHSPTKPYLSPVKDVSPKKNLFGIKSPLKSPLSSPVNIPAYQRLQHLTSPGKSFLTLPYSYRYLAELFRSIDTVCSILFNRKETITFSKLKPAVQEMIRKNLEEHHLAQIKSVYPEAFIFTREKMRVFGSREDKYELVIKPMIPSLNEDKVTMNPSILLERRRKFFNVLIENVKKYHNEFLLSLEPPMVISKDKLTRWHPEFPIDKIPEIEKSILPQPPEEEKLSTGREVLEKAKTMFNCNTRMERALERLKKIQELKDTSTQITSNATVSTSASVPSALKGIPQSLLEKVRAKQAAKALDAMTRCPNKDKESLMYSRLPDIARLMRNTYVVEKKGVLALEEVINKLNNSYRSFLTNSEIEQHLRLIAESVPGWLVFHEIRGTLFVKLSRDADMKRVVTKLEQLAKDKSES